MVESVQRSVSRDFEGVDPTLDEIRQRCAEIRATWSDREHRLRAGMRPIGWTVRAPLFRVVPPRGSRPPSFLAN